MPISARLAVKQVAVVGPGFHVVHNFNPLALRNWCIIDTRDVSAKSIFAYDQKTKPAIVRRETPR
ncbi:MAG TPA: hypothetical protein VEU98_02905, partial [Candidatus Eremiobacteraceae bacterium]|nr:hypothetical protein [Candidatus Eremiobacteraceae bacterium]